MHTKNNVPFNLAKRILCFVSNEQVLRARLAELRLFLRKCEYPENVIEKGIFNARLQGPAPEKCKSVIPLVTTNYSNLSLQHVIGKANHYLSNTHSSDLKETFQDSQLILSQKQPKNLLRLLTQSQFSTSQETATTEKIPITKCHDKRCKICAMYLQCVSSFKLATGKIWETRCTMSCKSKNVIYFLTCNRCNGKVSYIGKTVDLRKRTNGHISSSRTGNGTDIFDNHVFNCDGTGPSTEPYFKLFLMISVAEHSLLTYESHFHSMGFDTMNR